MNPSGQVHSGRWLMTRQLAYLPHGLSAHGFIHLVSRHAVYKGQSSSEAQPTATVGDVGRGAKIEDKIYDDLHSTTEIDLKILRTKPI